MLFWKTPAFMQSNTSCTILYSTHTNYMQGVVEAKNDNLHFKHSLSGPFFEGRRCRLNLF